MVHRCRQPDRNVLSVPVLIDQSIVSQQIVQRVPKAFGLNQIYALNAATRADNAVTWARHDVGRPIHHASTFFKFAREAIMQAGKFRFLASLKSRPENRFHAPIERSRTSGC